jgi:ABC-type Fe3+ transport system permease subunit
MQDLEETSPGELKRWKSWHWVAFIVPGTGFFLTLAIVFALKSSFVPVETEWPATHHEYWTWYFGTIASALIAGGIVAVPLCALVAIVMTRPVRDERKSSIIEKVLIFILLFPASFLVAGVECVIFSPFLKAGDAKPPVEPRMQPDIQSSPPAR